VAPVFFLLLFATIEGGRFILFYQALNNATREGARYAIVHGSNSSCPSGPMPLGQSPPLACYDPTGANVVQRVKDSAFGLLGPGVDVTVDWPSAEKNGRNGDVTVTAGYSYEPLVPLPFPEMTINAESRLVINN